MEGEHRAFDGQAGGNQRDDHCQGAHVLPGLDDVHHRLMQRYHQQMPCDAIEHRDAQQQKAGAKQVHDHIARGRDQGMPVLPHHHQSAAGDGHDLDKYIDGEQVVGINQHQDGGQRQVNHDAVEVGFLLAHKVGCMPHPGQQRDEEHGGETCGHQRFQAADADFIAPGRREMAHDKGIGLLQLQGKPEGKRAEHQHGTRHNKGQRFCGFGL